MTRIIEVTRRGRKGEDGQSGLTDTVTVSADRTLSNDDTGKAFYCTAACTLTIPASVTPGWSCIVDATGGTVTLSTSASINGGATLAVTSGNAVFIYSTGSLHFARFYVTSSVTTLNATAVAHTPTAANPATDVAAAIANIDGDLSTFGRTLTVAASAAAARTVLDVAQKIDEDDFASDSDTHSPTQQSTKAYVDGKVNNIAIPAAVIEEQRADGADGTTLTAGTWTKINLNAAPRNVGTVVSVASGEFTPSVDGWAEWAAPGCDDFQTRLYNVTDTAVVAQGTSHTVATNNTTHSIGGGAVVAGKTYRIEQNSSGTISGKAASRGGGEVYCQVRFYTKL